MKKKNTTFKIISLSVLVIGLAMAVVAATQKNVFVPSKAVISDLGNMGGQNLESSEGTTAGGSEEESKESEGSGLQDAGSITSGVVTKPALPATVPNPTGLDRCDGKAAGTRVDCFVSSNRETGDPIVYRNEQNNKTKEWSTFRYAVIVNDGAFAVGNQFNYSFSGQGTGFIIAANNPKPVTYNGKTIPANSNLTFTLVYGESGGVQQVNLVNTEATATKLINLGIPLALDGIIVGIDIEQVENPAFGSASTVPTGGFKVKAPSCPGCVEKYQGSGTGVEHANQYYGSVSEAFGNVVNKFVSAVGTGNAVIPTLIRWFFNME